MLQLSDTNIVSYLYDERSPYHETVVRRFHEAEDSHRFCMSFLTIYEFQYSLFRSPSHRSSNVERTIRYALDDFEVVLPPTQSARIFGELKHKLRTHHVQSDKGIAKYDADLMIASSAIAIGAVLVSNDTIFESLVGLHPDFRLENWALPLA